MACGDLWIKYMYNVYARNFLHTFQMWKRWCKDDDLKFHISAFMKMTFRTYYTAGEFSRKVFLRQNQHTQCSYNLQHAAVASKMCCLGTDKSTNRVRAGRGAAPGRNSSDHRSRHNTSAHKNHAEITAFNEHTPTCNHTVHVPRCHRYINTQHDLIYWCAYKWSATQRSGTAAESATMW